MPKFYCEYCGIYLTNSSPATRKEHDQGRKHVQSRIDYFAQILIEAHQEGTLKKINDVFAHEENIPNLRQDVLKNPYNNTVINTHDWTNWTIAGLEAPSIYYMPIPGMNATMPINQNDSGNNMLTRLRNLIPYNLVQVPQKPLDPAAAPAATGLKK